MNRTININSKKLNKQEVIRLRVTKQFKENIKQQAKECGISMSSYIVITIEDNLSKYNIEKLSKNNG